MQLIGSEDIIDSQINSREVSDTEEEEEKMVSTPGKLVVPPQSEKVASQGSDRSRHSKPEDQIVSSDNFEKLEAELALQKEKSRVEELQQVASSSQQENKRLRGLLQKLEQENKQMLHELEELRIDKQEMKKELALYRDKLESKNESKEEKYISQIAANEQKRELESEIESKNRKIKDLTKEK